MLCCAEGHHSPQACPYQLRTTHVHRRVPNLPKLLQAAHFPSNSLNRNAPNANVFVCCCPLALQAEKFQIVNGFYFVFALILGKHYIQINVVYQSFFPNSNSFGVFSHSKGFGAELLSGSLWFSGADLSLLQVQGTLTSHPTPPTSCSRYENQYQTRQPRWALRSASSEIYFLDSRPLSVK